MINVIIIGLGHHAKRIYYPCINQLKNRVKIVGIVDLVSNQKEINEFLYINDDESEKLFLKSKDGKDNLQKVTDFASKLNANAIVISTPPEYHFIYAMWSLHQGR